MFFRVEVILWRLLRGKENTGQRRPEMTVLSGVRVGFVCRKRPANLWLISSAQCVVERNDALNFVEAVGGLGELGLQQVPAGSNHFQIVL